MRMKRLLRSAGAVAVGTLMLSFTAEANNNRATCTEMAKQKVTNVEVENAMRDDAYTWYSRAIGGCNRTYIRYYCDRLYSDLMDQIKKAPEIRNNLSYVQNGLIGPNLDRAQPSNGTYITSKELSSIKYDFAQYYKALLVVKGRRQLTDEQEELFEKFACGDVMSLIAQGDTAIVNASSRGDTGVCQIHALGSKTYSVLVGNKTYPIKGYTFSGVKAAAAGLREALDARLCKIETLKKEIL